MSGAVAITGATGFVGRALLHSLRGKRPVVALARHALAGEAASDTEWRQADFFSVDSVAEGLRGARTAIYLIHSMMPTARLDQSTFEDADLWLADTFGRAAARAGVERIIYLGGLVPEGGRLSPHLQSRKEVEDALGATGVPVLTLRAGTRMQPVSLKDVVRLVDFCIERSDIPAGPYDIGGPHILTYRDLMLDCVADAAPNLRTETRKRRQDRHLERDVRSIQRLRVPQGWDAREVARSYFAWVGKVMRPWVRVETDEAGAVRFVVGILRIRKVLLELRRRAVAVSGEIECFEIVGGALLKRARPGAGPPGTFEFRISRSGGYALAGLHGFYPRLPWAIYKVTQAVAHQLIMKFFVKWLVKQPRLAGSGGVPAPSGAE